MSFFKALLLAIVATVFITFVLGTGFLEMMDLQVYVNNDLIAPMQAIGVSAMVTVLLVLVALAIVLSVFGTMIFVGMLVIGGLAMAFIGVFWPILLIALIIWGVSRNKAQPQKA